MVFICRLRCAQNRKRTAGKGFHRKNFYCSNFRYAAQVTTFRIFILKKNSLFLIHSQAFFQLFGHHLSHRWRRNNLSLFAACEKLFAQIQIIRNLKRRFKIKRFRIAELFYFRINTIDNISDIVRNILSVSQHHFLFFPYKGAQRL